MEKTKLRFIVDVGVSKKVEKWLSQNGYDVKTVRDIDPRLPDIQILTFAVDENRMVVTMDKDFGELVFHSGLSHCGVLLLRLEEATADERVRTVKKILDDYGDELFNHFCVYQDGKLRIRK